MEFMRKFLVISIKNYVKNKKKSGVHVLIGVKLRAEPLIRYVTLVIIGFIKMPSELCL